MLTIGSRRSKIVIPADKIRSGWEKKYDQNKDAIAQAIANKIKSSVMGKLLDNYSNGYALFPKRSDPFGYSIKLTPITVYEILRECDTPHKAMAPFREWKKALSKNQNIDTGYFDKFIDDLAHRVAEIFPQKITKACEKQKLSNFKNKSNFLKDDNGVVIHTRIWASSKMNPDSPKCRKQRRWTHNFNKNYPVTAAKIADVFLERIRADFTQRCQDPYGLPPSKSRVWTFDLNFKEALGLISKSIPVDDLLAPFDQWVNDLDWIDDTHTDFKFFKSKISILFKEIDSCLSDKTKKLNREGIKLKTSLIITDFVQTYTVETKINKKGEDIKNLINY